MTPIGTDQLGCLSNPIGIEVGHLVFCLGRPFERLPWTTDDVVAGDDRWWADYVVLLEASGPPEADVMRGSLSVVLCKLPAALVNAARDSSFPLYTREK